MVHPATQEQAAIKEEGLYRKTTKEIVLLGFTTSEERTKEGKSGVVALLEGLVVKIAAKTGSRIALPAILPRSPTAKTTMEKQTKKLP